VRQIIELKYEIVLRFATFDFRGFQGIKLGGATFFGRALGMTY
jgi:hypothetical protein